MIYADYARRKMHNVVKLGTAEGYPLVINNAEGKKLKDYTIEGNTEYGENLFNYNAKYNDFKVDKYGWLTITVDNTNGTSQVYKWVHDKPSMSIKPNTQYYLYAEVEMFQVEGTKLDDYNYYLYFKSDEVYSQFSKPSFVRCTTVGTYKKTLTSLDDFSKCNYMLRTFIVVPMGLKITVKFRIAVYETEKDVFLPYTKTSVGDMTENLFNYTEPLTNSIKAGENGWFDVAIDNTDGTATKYVPCYTSANENLKLDTTYSIFVEIAEISTDVKCYAISNNITQTSTGQFVSNSILSNTTGIQKFTNKTRTSFDNCANMLRTIVFAEAGKSGHIKFRIAVYETEKDYFEPYNKYKIPIVVSGENNTTIYLNAPLADGESINYKADNLPDIVLNKGSNTITTDTAVKPKKISAKYYKK